MSVRVRALEPSLQAIQPTVLASVHRGWTTLNRVLGHPAALGGVCCCLVLANTLPLLGAWWGPIDDHEMALYLAPSHTLDLPRAWAFFLETEAGHPGGSNRFRPAYYAVRLLEAVLVGDHPEVFYAGRILMTVFTLTVLAWMLRGVVATVENLVLTGWVLTFPLWEDLTAHLGPAEMYAAVGLALYAVGADLLFRRRRRRTSGAGAACLWLAGGVLASGAKENMLFLGLPTLLLLGLELWRGARRPHVVGAAVGMLAFMVFVAGAVVVGVTKHGTLYHQDAAPSHRLRILILGAEHVWANSALWVVLPLAVCALGLTFSRSPRVRRVLLHTTSRTGVALLLLGVLHLSQLVFYDGRWPSGPWCCGRYDFPGVLAVPLALHAGYRWLLHMARLARIPTPLLTAARSTVTLVLLVGVVQLEVPLRVAAEKTFKETHVFHEKLETLVRHCREQPDWPVVLSSHSALDYEWIVSLPRFMGLAGAQPRVFLNLHLAAGASSPSSLEHELVLSMERWAREGLSPLVLPGRQFPGPPCWGVRLRGAPGVCTPSVDFP